MELENSPIYDEVVLITRAGELPVSYYWEAKIHMLSTDETEDIVKVVSINNDRNYEVKFADELMIETIIPLGQYAKVVYPDRDTLEMTLTRIPLYETGSTVRANANLDSERYKAVIVLDGLPPVSGTGLSQMNREALDNQDLLTARFQLLSKAAEKLRVLDVGGIFRKVKPVEVVRSILAAESAKQKVDGNNSIEGVDIVEENNTQKREHIVIPQGTHLLRIPTFVQERCGGIYSTGIGSYLQNKVWYVYPLYDTTKLDKAQKTVTLIKVPKERYMGIERTYRFEGDSLFVLGTSNTSFKDDAHTEIMNEGNGVRLADASQFMFNSVDVKNNKAVMKRGKLNSEFVTQQSADGVNVVRNSTEAISANPFIEYSKLASRNGGIFSFIWDNANPSLLFPGMKVRILFIDGEELKELHGVLLGVQILTQLAERGLFSNKHITTCNLSVFCTKHSKT